MKAPSEISVAFMSTMPSSGIAQKNAGVFGTRPNAAFDASRHNKWVG